MVTMHRAEAWKIAVYGREHGVPHFHIEGPGFRCSVAIATLDLIIGPAPRTVLRDVLVLAEQNRTRLTRQWWELNG